MLLSYAVIAVIYACCRIFRRRHVTSRRYMRHGGDASVSAVDM